MTPAADGRAPRFDERAARYDDLRPTSAAWWERFEVLVEAADLRGRRLLDVGCGTGQLATALVERAHAKVWGIDPSAEMLAVARRRVPRGVGLKRACAEDLPFRDGWFDRVTMSLVVHLVDRPAAFAEAFRVLAPGGRLAIATFHPDHFDGYWLRGFFPSIAVIDRHRFPSPRELERQLASAGFAATAAIRVRSVETLAREQALARIRGRHISTFDLLDADELREGSARAERELPDRVEVRLEQLVVVAHR